MMNMFYVIKINKKHNQFKTQTDYRKELKYVFGLMNTDFIIFS